MGHRAGLDERKISTPPVFVPRTVQPVAQLLYRLSYVAHSSDTTQKNFFTEKLLMLKISLRPSENWSSQRDLVEPKVAFNCIRNKGKGIFQTRRTTDN